MDETWNGVPLSEIGAMTHWPEQSNPAIAELARRLNLTGQNLYNTWLAPAQRLGEAATSGTLDVTDPETAGNALSLVGSVAGARIPFVKAGELGALGGGGMKPIKGGGVRMGTPEFEDYPRAADVRSNMNDNLRFPDFERQQAALKASQSVPLSALGGSPEKIQAAATRYGGKVYTGDVHYQSLEAAAQDHGMDISQFIDKVNKEAGKTEATHDLDGFITSNGRFVTRDEARQIADRADQLTGLAKRENNPKLSMEELKIGERPGFGQPSFKGQ